MKIIIKFDVDPDDLAEVMDTLLNAPSRGPVDDLADLLQWALYDRDEGPQLLGNFNVIQKP